MGVMDGVEVSRITSPGGELNLPYWGNENIWQISNVSWMMTLQKIFCTDQSGFASNLDSRTPGLTTFLRVCSFRGSFPRANTR